LPTQLENRFNGQSSVEAGPYNIRSIDYLGSGVAIRGKSFPLDLACNKDLKVALCLIASAICSRACDCSLSYWEGAA
jgi:hypothetical protein